MFLSIRLRSFSSMLVTFGLLATFLILAYLLHDSVISPVRLGPVPKLLSSIPWASSESNPLNHNDDCPPDAYANGTWLSKADYDLTNSSITEPSKAMAYAGFEGCAGNREIAWHLGAESHNAGYYDRFPNLTSFEWIFGKGCRTRTFDKENMVKDLVESGGWLLIGDSTTEAHFFSLSCSLYPHVIATPDYTVFGYPRDFPQNLYLNPNSSLVHDQTLSFPPTFNITSTPLVTFRRIDYLFLREELAEMHRTFTRAEEEQDGYSLFNAEIESWSASPKEYLDWFLDPEKNYRTMVVSTAGHWTTQEFSGYRNKTSEDFNAGIDGLMDFFEIAMNEWVKLVGEHLDIDEASRRILGGESKLRKQVVVRAYLPGHEHCHDAHKPWTEYQYADAGDRWYNWAFIPEFNDIFQRVITKFSHPQIHYLPIDRPGRLRPDIHVTWDCLHIVAGPGVMEGWTHYIWHFVTREVGRIRWQ